jgi:2-dehydropantoate 2-reductase
MLDQSTTIAIAGAGSIGCYAGGSLALAGRRVALLARARIADAVRDKGLSIADLGGGERRLLPAAMATSDDPAAAFAGAGIVLVTVKSRDTSAMAKLIASHAPADAVVVSLQNGTGNAPLLRERLPKSQRVIAGMVPFNVVQGETADGLPSFRRTTSGEILVEEGVPGLVDLLNVAGLPVASAPDMNAVLWGKLTLNLNNALNALSGLPLVEQLSDRRWRLLLARQLDEALAAMCAAGIRPAKIGALRPALLPYVLRLPDFLFRILARRMLSVDPKARPSTAEDLERGRPTEVDEFQGAIVRLAERHGTKAPLSRLVLDRIRTAEATGKGSPRLSPEELSIRS